MLKPLLAYADEASLEAQVSVRIDRNRRLQFLLPKANSARLAVRIGCLKQVLRVSWSIRDFAERCGQTVIQANPMIALSNYKPGWMEIL